MSQRWELSALEVAAAAKRVRKFVEKDMAADQCGGGLRSIILLEKKKTTTKAPMPRKVPRGSWYWLAMAQRSFATGPRPRRLARSATWRFQPMAKRMTIRARPRMLPRSVPSKIVMKEPCRPTKAPTMAIILTSPKPMPSRLRRSLYKEAAPQSKKLPKAAPKRASRMLVAQSG